eukprot:scpid31568/ scgid5203/ 
MGSNQSKLDDSNDIVASAEQDDSKWEESLNSVTSLDLAGLSVQELEAVETVVRIQLEFEQKEARMLRALEAAASRHISTASPPSLDSAPNSPRKRAATWSASEESCERCPQCGTETPCIKQRICFPEASKMTQWSACQNCTLKTGTQLTTGKWFHGHDLERSIAMSKAMLTRIAECKPHATVEPTVPDSISLPLAGKADTLSAELDTPSPITPLSTSSTLSRAKPKGNSWAGRIQAYISHDNSGKTMNVAVSKVLDLVDVEPHAPIGIQVALQPQRSSADCQVSKVAYSRDNGSVEVGQVLSWPRLKRKEANTMSLQISVWFAKPLELLGKADVSLSSMLKGKGDSSPQFFSLFYNANASMYDQVVALPSFAFLDIQEELSVRRSTVQLAESAAAKQLGRIASAQDITDIDNIEVRTPAKFEKSDGTLFFGAESQDIFLEKRSFQNNSTVSSSADTDFLSSVEDGNIAEKEGTSTLDSSMKEFEDEIAEVSSQLDLLEEEEKDKPHVPVKDDTDDDSDCRHNLPTLENIAEGLDDGTELMTPSSVGRGVIVVTDELGSVHNRESFAIPEKRATLLRGSSLEHSETPTPEDSTPEADRMIAQTSWTGRQISPVKGYQPKPKDPKQDAATYSPVARERDQMTKESPTGLPNPYVNISKNPQAAMKGIQYSPERSVDTASLESSPSRTGSPVSTTDVKSAYTTSIRLSIQEVRIYALEVTVHQVKNVDRFQLDGRPVPSGLYCKIYMTSDGKKFKAKTRPVAYANNVTFDETLTLNGRLQNAELEVMIWETHGLVGRHVMTCTCNISIPHLNLKRHTAVTHWYKLMQPMLAPAATATGTGTELKRAPSRGSLSSWVFHKQR